MLHITLDDFKSHINFGGQKENIRVICNITPSNNTNHVDQGLEELGLDQ
jgi:hypothetical protein